MFSQIGIVSSVNSKLVEDTIQEVIQTINTTAAKALLDDRIRVVNLDGEFNVCPLQTLPETCDLIISIGGDGTLLQCAKVIFPNQVALLGINLGRLGFLADLSAKNVNKDLIKLVKFKKIQILKI